MNARSRARPPGVTALSAFFAAGLVASSTAALSLLWAGGPLEPIWLLNPAGRAGFARLGVWAVPLLVVVALACGLAAFGLWRGRRWGRRLAIAVLSVNAAGDLGNATLGADARTAIGIPIAALLIVYLLRPRVRAFFEPERAAEQRPVRSP